jgi:hypothetical protein
MCRRIREDEAEHDLDMGEGVSAGTRLMDVDGDLRWDVLQPVDPGLEHKVGQILLGHRLSGHRVDDAAWQVIRPFLHHYFVS